MADKIMSTITTSDDYFSPINPNVYSEWAAGAGLSYRSMIKSFVRYTATIFHFLFRRPGRKGHEKGLYLWGKGTH